MILVTGGTGFVGSVLIPNLLKAGKEVRLLLRPSPVSPRLPKGVSVEVAVCSLKDERGLRAALKGVDTVIHLAGAERQSTRANLTEVDVEGAQAIAQVAALAGVRRMLYLSHLGADKNSAYPVLKAKAFAEAAVQQSGIPYTIFRSAALFGPGDQFTTSFARLIRASKPFVLMPGDGDMLLQPLWIEDLVTAMIIALDEESMYDQTISVGGAEILTFRQVIETIMQTIGVRRWLIPFSPAYLRILALWVEQVSPRFPVSLFWLDYLSADRTCALDTMPRVFGLMPVRFHQNLQYLQTYQHYKSHRRQDRR
ncbi:MAG TPA: NAD-dependent epimerase/dehydratase family protein [Anaerolineaceae bacterium]|nr:NAD-dependent epimerase/dehydratase family protein [Anaerolineaceae bacterium]